MTSFRRTTQTHPLLRLMEFCTGIGVGFLFLTDVMRVRGETQEAVLTHSGWHDC